MSGSLPPPSTAPVSSATGGDSDAHVPQPAGKAPPGGPPPLTSLILAEFLGTFLLVLFGCGSVHAAVLTGAQSGLWQVAIVWGVSIMLAIYVVGGISGAHINPAITVALALWRGFPVRLVAPYVLAQVLGAFLAAALLFSIYAPYLERLEIAKQVIRGAPGSEITAMCYGEYFPNPGELAAAPGPYDPEAHARLRQLVSHPAAFCVEMLGTMILALVVFAVSDPRNSAAPTGRLAPVFIGLTVAALISILAPLTQACFNPARDFGPRLFAYIAGWGEIAIPGPSSPAFLTVYILAPTIGALLGGGLYELFLRPYVADESTERTT